MIVDCIKKFKCFENLFKLYYLQENIEIMLKEFLLWNKQYIHLKKYLDLKKM